MHSILPDVCATLRFDLLSLQITSVDNGITTAPLLYSFMFTVVRKFGALFIAVYNYRIFL